MTAKSAVAIETDVLKSWRSTLGLRSYLTRSQMPQGGWTETVAAGRVDLPATVARICKLALRPEARACVLASGQSPLPRYPRGLRVRAASSALPRHPEPRVAVWLLLPARGGAFWPAGGRSDATTRRFGTEIGANRPWR